MYLRRIKASAYFLFSFYFSRWPPETIFLTDVRTSDWPCDETLKMIHMKWYFKRQIHRKNFQYATCFI